MTAVTDLIAQLKQYRYSAEPSQVIADIDTLVLALQELESGGSVDPFEVIELLINSFTYLSAIVDGNLLLRNSAKTDFGLLQFGGITAAFPAIKRNAAIVALRLADDSGDADLTAAAATFSGQLIGGGTTTNDNATAGDIGEFLSVTVASGAAIPLVSGTIANIATLALTPGDWDVRCNCNFIGGATVSVTNFRSGLNNVSGTFPGTATTGYNEIAYGGGQNITELTQQAGPVRFSLNANATIYMVARGVFAVDTLAAFGNIQARRVR